METQLLALIDTEACLGNSTIYMKVESEISAQTSWHVATEKPNKCFVSMPSAVIDEIITWAETKITKEKKKWTLGRLLFKYIQ